MKYLIIAFFSLTLMILSCDNHDHDKHDHAKMAVELNNGERWLANPETSAGVTKMLGIASESISENSAEAYQKIGNRLSEEMDIIFAKCSMTGEAHEQLHHYLEPLIAHVEALQKCKSSTAGDEVQQKTLAHLKAFQKYFN